jgi:hypothetical protein
LSKDRSKEILREINSLRRELEERLDAIEKRLGNSNPRADRVGPSASVSTLNFPAGSNQDPGSSGLAGSEDQPPVSWPSAAPPGAPREVSLTVRPLVDVSLARAIENSLSDTDGIESARLSSLSGDSAVIQALVAPGVSVVNTLRRQLPVAFDVTESSDHAISIELATSYDDHDPAQTEPETEH